jgi:hypothetical protein
VRLFFGCVCAALYERRRTIVEGRSQGMCESVGVKGMCESVGVMGMGECRSYGHAHELLSNAIRVTPIRRCDL